MARLTIDVSELQAGDLIVEAEELGPVRHIREVPVVYGSDKVPGVGYRVYGELLDDLFAAPQRLEVERTAM